MSALSLRVPDRHIALVGSMGVGKSTIGRRLAEHLRRPFVDNDALIRELGSADVAAVTRRDGEEAMRALEAKVLRLQLDHDRPAVLPVAAGTILSADNRERLARDAVVVWLTAPVDVLAARVARSPQPRPFAQDDSSVVLGELLRTRSSLYRRVAELVVDVSHQDVEENVDAVAAALRSLQRRTRVKLVKFFD